MHLQNATTENWIERVTKRSLDGLKIYQAVIFTGDHVDSYAKQENHMVSEFSQKVPVFIINLRKLQGGSHTQKLLKSTYSTLFVILSTDAYKQTKDYLYIISNLLSAAPRPKCLLIIFQEKNSLPSNDEVLKILLHAWNLRYLDFTLIKN